MGRNPPNHGPNRLQNYFEIHNTVLQKFKDRGFVGEDTLELDIYGSDLYMVGELGCLGNIVIRVEKKLEFVESPEEKNPAIQTVYYSYNVSIRNEHNIFRYDNQDEDFSFRSGHSDEHHKHLYDLHNGEEVDGSPIWIGAHAWPTLGQTIEEAEIWYWMNKESLRKPDEYPILGLR